MTWTGSELSEGRRPRKRKNRVSSKKDLKGFSKKISGELSSDDSGVMKSGVRASLELSADDMMEIKHMTTDVHTIFQTVSEVLEVVKHAHRPHDRMTDIWTHWESKDGKIKCELNGQETSRKKKINQRRLGEAEKMSVVIRNKKIIAFVLEEWFSVCKFTTSLIKCSATQTEIIGYDVLIMILTDFTSDKDFVRASETQR